MSGEVDGAASDHQFGIYVRLRLSAVDVLEDSQQFKRDLDNSMNHSGDPINYRAQAVSPPFRSPSRSIGGTATSTSTIDRQCSRRVWDSRHESLVLTRVELTSTPNALADASECAARAAPLCRPLPLEYGEGFGINVRFNTRSGEAGVLRGLWRKENTSSRRVKTDRRDVAALVEEPVSTQHLARVRTPESTASSRPTLELGQPRRGGRHTANG